jgi:hypothetical protein
VTDAEFASKREEVFITFIRDRSLRCLTINILEEIHQSLKQGDGSNSIFNKAQNLVFETMRRGAYNRFLHSSFGKQYVFTALMSRRQQMYVLLTAPLP